MSIEHVPVMKAEVLQHLQPAGAGWILDATVGLGGHAAAILSTESFTGRLLGLDRDPKALEIASQRLESFGDRVRLHHGEFAELEAVLDAEGVERVDGLLLDLGVSSMQLETPERGFSFLREGPLDMRMDTSRGRPLSQLLSRIGPRELEQVLSEYGEERYARRIAQAIIEAHQAKTLYGTGQLAEVIDKVVPHRPGPKRLHPATRTFQALRILVNRELDQLSQAISDAHKWVNPQGRLVVLSYHSLEDRIVKHTLRDRAKEGLWKVLTKKPLKPGEDEVRDNPRSRSALLRAFERCDD